MKTLILFIFIMAGLTAACAVQQDVTSQAKSLGIFLCENSFTNTIFNLSTNRDIPLIVSIETNLLNELYKYKDEFWQDFQVDVFTGDSANGDGTASHFIILKSKDRDVLGIRLNYNTALKKFDILSYWSFLDY
ncbi:MAG: hypothetical protein A2Y33_15870 [Spirochaetes bacterium GWF1_51_8]|nr:MAG: hypothetical protein A2Y33_15870 [Spirochaetes bacterium GWF1_51_8]